MSHTPLDASSGGVMKATQTFGKLLLPMIERLLLFSASACSASDLSMGSAHQLSMQTFLTVCPFGCQHLDAVPQATSHK
jgi:hypothetical protein